MPSLYFQRHQATCQNWKMQIMMSFHQNYFLINFKTIFIIIWNFENAWNAGQSFMRSETRSNIEHRHRDQSSLSHCGESSVTRSSGSNRWVLKKSELDDSENKITQIASTQGNETRLECQNTQDFKIQNYNRIKSYWGRINRLKWFMETWWRKIGGNLGRRSTGSFSTCSSCKGNGNLSPSMRGWIKICKYENKERNQILIEWIVNINK